MKLLSQTECELVVGGNLNSDPWIVFAGIIGVILFVYSFLPVPL